MRVGYCVTTRFDSRSGEAWTSYLEFSCLHHLNEVVGFDSGLCPIEHDTMTAEDWQHDAGLGISGVFSTAQYARSRVAMTPAMQLLAIAREPAEDDLLSANLQGFELMGFDLINSGGMTSALTNCDGFPKALNAMQLSKEGLLGSVATAYATQEALRVHYPEEHHAFCDVWAIWRWTGAFAGEGGVR